MPCDGHNFGNCETCMYKRQAWSNLDHFGADNLALWTCRTHVSSTSITIFCRLILLSHLFRAVQFEIVNEFLLVSG